MKRFLALVSVCLVVCLCMSGCNVDIEEERVPGGNYDEEVTTQPEEEIGITINVAALNGPTAMGMIKMIDDVASDETVSETGTSNDYSFGVYDTPDEVASMIIKETIDIAAVPANLASVLYNKTDKNISVLAINTLGVLYICEKGDTVQSVADLKGKTIYASGKGATPEYALNYILEQNGLEPGKDVTIEWKSEHSECVSAIESDEDGIAMLPQPFVTTAQLTDSDIRVALDLTEEWDTLQSGEENPSALVTGVVIVNNDFLETHPNAISKFMDDYQSSVEFVNNNVEEAAALIGQYDIVKEEVAKLAIPECNITFLEGTEMKDKLSGYLTVLSEQDIDAVGGSLPDEAFYYQCS